MVTEGAKTSCRRRSRCLGRRSAPERMRIIDDGHDDNVKSDDDNETATTHPQLLSMYRVAPAIRTVVRWRGCRRQLLPGEGHEYLSERLRGRRISGAHVLRAKCCRWNLIRCRGTADGNARRSGSNEVDPFPRTVRRISPSLHRRSGQWRRVHLRCLNEREASESDLFSASSDHV